MTRCVPLSWLALAAAGALILDLSVASTLSIADGGEEVAMPMPVSLPVPAFLTGAVADSGTVDGIAVAITRGEPGDYVLELTNPGETDREVELDVAVYQTSGLMVGRMGPMRTQVDTERILAAIPAGSSLRRPLSWHPTEATANHESELVGPDMALNDLVLADLAFTTTEFSVGAVTSLPVDNIVDQAWLRVVEDTPSIADALFSPNGG